MDQVKTEIFRRTESGVTSIPVPGDDIVETFREFEFSLRDMEQVVPQLGISLHGGNNLGKTIFAVNV